MSSTYEVYKPLQNVIKNFELYDSLLLCWQFSNFFDYKKPLPRNIELPLKIKHPVELVPFQVYVINSWELEFLVSEIILYAPDRVWDHKKSLIRMSDRDKVVNNIRRIRDNSYKSNKDEDVFIELNRMAHQQFHLQVFSKADFIYRNYFIFNSEKINKMVLDTYNLTTLEIFKTGLVLYGLFSSNFAVKLPIKTEIKLVTEEAITKFLSVFSLDISELRKKIVASRKYDDTLLYQFNLIKQYPLILHTDLLCPIPNNLFRQINSGLYYGINRIRNFDQEFGNAFQKYLLLVLEKTNTRNRLTILPEKTYGKSEKKTADIIVKDDTAVLLVECKTKRMIWKSKESLSDTQDLDKDIRILASALYQLYKTFRDYKSSLYPQLKYTRKEKVYLMVVTLEDWYVGYNPFLYEKIRDYIIENFIEENIAATDLVQVPYFIFSAEEFELASQIMNEVGIESYLGRFLTEGGHDAHKDFARRLIFEKEMNETFH
jgi:hypothetical protein